jgi:phage terminase large subunit-like protein
MPEYEIHLPEPHDKQKAFIQSPAKRKVIRAGRRGGKTVGMSIYAVERFLAGKRILYAAPTSEQIDRFWTTVSRALYQPIEARVFSKNETEHVIELPGTEQRIRAKTAWNADSLRGDYADELILDEWQLMNEDAWGVVGAPMMLDNNGNATFVYTPPSLHSRSVSKATDPRHAAKLYKRAQQDETGRWQVFNFTSHDNPHLSREALSEITSDMTSLAYRMEIMAEDIDEAPGALWKRENLDNLRVMKSPDMNLVIVGVDPSATATGDEAGIVTAGSHDGQYYILADDSVQGSPNEWAKAAVTAYYRHSANKIVAEANNGGEMVQLVINQVDASVPVELVHASRGKATRAEPIAAIYEQGRAHHVGAYPSLEDEMCLWMPGDSSPNRMDALVWAITKLSSGSNWVMS